MTKHREHSTSAWASLGFMVRIFAVRHGQSEANVAGVLAGRLPGVALTESGRAGVRALAEMFPVTRVDALVHSTVERCMETSRLLMESVHAESVRADSAFDEVDYGSWQGRKLTDLATLPEWTTVTQAPSAMVFPQGEGLADASQRAVHGVHALVAELRKAHATPDDPAKPATGIIVSHGDILKAMVAAALGMPLDDFQRIAIAPGSLTVLDYPEVGPPTLSALSVTATGTLGQAGQLGGGDAA